MSQISDVEGLLREWLEDGPQTAPQSVLRMTADHARTHPRRAQAGWRWTLTVLPWSAPVARRLTLLWVVVLLALALVVGALAIGAWRPDRRPALLPSLPVTVDPSPSPVPPSIGPAQGEPVFEAPALGFRVGYPARWPHPGVASGNMNAGPPAEIVMFERAAFGTPRLSIFVAPAGDGPFPVVGGIRLSGTSAEAMARSYKATLGEASFEEDLVVDGRPAIRVVSVHGDPEFVFVASGPYRYVIAGLGSIGLRSFLTRWEFTGAADTAPSSPFRSPLRTFEAPGLGFGIRSYLAWPVPTVAAGDVGRSPARIVFAERHADSGATVNGQMAHARVTVTVCVGALASGVETPSGAHIQGSTLAELADSYQATLPARYQEVDVLVDGVAGKRIEAVGVARLVVVIRGKRIYAISAYVPTGYDLGADLMRFLERFYFLP